MLNLDAIRQSPRQASVEEVAEMADMLYTYKEHLKELVVALDSAFISSWQSTAGWQKELDEARELLEQTA